MPDGGSDDVPFPGPPDPPGPPVTCAHDAVAPTSAKPKPSVITPRYLFIFCSLYENLPLATILFVVGSSGFRPRRPKWSAIDDRRSRLDSFIEMFQAQYQDVRNSAQELRPSSRRGTAPILCCVTSIPAIVDRHHFSASSVNVQGKVKAEMTKSSDNKVSPDLGERFRAFITSSRFPCVGAKSAIAKGQLISSSA